MAGIYAADIFCDDCIDEINLRIAREIWAEGPEAVLPDGTVLRDHLGPDGIQDCTDLHEYLRWMDERSYDSGDYPKYCSDDDESDCPEHCGSHADCINAGELDDGFKYGYCFGNSLTSDGIEYVKEAVRDGEPDGIARQVWAVEYDWIDFDESED